MNCRMLTEEEIKKAIADNGQLVGTSSAAVFDSVTAQFGAAGVKREPTPFHVLVEYPAIHWDQETDLLILKAADTFLGKDSGYVLDKRRVQFRYPDQDQAHEALDRILALPVIDLTASVANY